MFLRFTALVMLLALLGVDCNVLMRTRKHTALLKRKEDYTDCLNRLADNTWNVGKPPNATAAICVHGNFDLTYWDDQRQQHSLDTRCYGPHSDWLGSVDSKSVMCFYLMKPNSFKAHGDCGSKNLAIRHVGCNWSHGEKNLTCF